MHDVTLLLRKVEAGDRQAAEQLLPLVYGELRKLAAAKMARESAALTLQPTALVHEAWLRLGGDEQPTWQNRAHFFAAAAEAMRRILIEAARRRRAQRHGGGLQRADVFDSALNIAAPDADSELLAVHEVLEELEQHDKRKAEVVKLRYFAALSLEEVAEVLGIGIATANRDWAYARAWLYERMQHLRS